jgi:hypothetical protein
MLGKIVRLKQTPGGEQWEGVLETGQIVVVREGRGQVRIDLDGVTVSNLPGDDAYAVLAEMFDIDRKALE